MEDTVTPRQCKGYLVRNYQPPCGAVPHRLTQGAWSNGIYDKNMIEQDAEDYLHVYDKALQWSEGRVNGEIELKFLQHQ